MASPETSFLKKVFPEQANNDYRGSPIALYTFCLLMLPMTFRSLVHLLKDDSGANSIASILVFPGNPDPNVVIHAFSSLWGGQQLVMVMLYALVLVRYRNLLPLLYVTFLLENLFRVVTGTLHPLTPAHFEHTPPGAYVSIPAIVIALVMLFLSTRTRVPSVGQEPAQASVDQGIA